MKRILLLALALMLLTAAHAQVPEEMQIINCEEWVSLRAQPDASSQRYAEVPLGETVRGFFDPKGDFSLCEYEGRVGYIMNKYLQERATVLPVTLPQGEPSYEIEMETGSLKVWRGFGATGEIMRLGCYDAAGELIWSYQTETLMSTELSGVDVFLNLYAPESLVMVHNTSFGLIALDASTGEEAWVLPRSEVHLGGSIIYAVTADGSMYIGGYYGPDPVCISADGRVKWEASSLHTNDAGEKAGFTWLNSIVVLSDGIAAYYNNCDEPVWVGYDLKGKMIAWEYDSAQ